MTEIFCPSHQSEQIYECSNDFMMSYAVRVAINEIVQP